MYMYGQHTATLHAAKVVSHHQAAVHDGIIRLFVAPSSASTCRVLSPPTTTHCRLVTPPADAAVHTMLMGPWSSAGFAGPESVVVPAAALAPGRYTVQLTATQPSTTFTLQVCCRV